MLHLLILHPSLQTKDQKTAKVAIGPQPPATAMCNTEWNGYGTLLLRGIQQKTWRKTCPFIAAMLTVKL